MKLGSKVRGSFAGGLVSVMAATAVLSVAPAIAAPFNVDSFTGHTPFRVKRHSTASPVGLDPATIKAVYNLSGSGSGTVAIVDAYHYPTALNDLNKFSAQYGLPTCSSSTCFEQHEMAPRIKTNGGWSLEAALDTQWAHAIAPGAKILLVEARSASGSDLLSAVNYARNRADVVAVSMSWGSGEFSGEASYDGYFTSNHGVAFFASSGDSGTGVSWPAVSPNVVSVGGTSLTLSGSTLVSETAWSGSGGGVSLYENLPLFQSAYGLTGTKRAVPDVSYNADPNSGVAVYDSTSYQGQTGWYQVGGTSAGAPQWAAVKALGGSVSNAKVYQDAKLVNSSSFLRDITAGTNGACGVVCTAATGYDTVTGLGSPVTSAF